MNNQNTNDENTNDTNRNEELINAIASKNYGNINGEVDIYRAYELANKNIIRNKNTQ